MWWIPSTVNITVNIVLFGISCNFTWHTLINKLRNIRDYITPTSQFILGLASYRHLKTVRTHLASLVHPCAGATYDDDIQALYDKGLTKEIWYNMKNEGLVRRFFSKSLLIFLNLLSAYSTKWSSTFKQFLGFCRQIVWLCLTIFVGLALKELSKPLDLSINPLVPDVH